MQIVYISNRLSQLAESLEYICNLMPFINDIIVCCPDSEKDTAQNLQAPVRVIYESELALPSELASDHALRNITLRYALFKHSAIASRFILADDDYRPLCHIKLEDFLSEEKYVPYYFFELKDWRYAFSSFDASLRNTYQLLHSMDLPSKAYSSHMPQIFDKALLYEVLAVFEPTVTQGIALADWDVYFNYCIHHYPEKFHTPVPFCTMGWPNDPLDWEMTTPPSRVLFENFYEQNYLKDGLFEDLPRKFDPQLLGSLSMEKYRRWSARMHEHNIARQFAEHSTQRSQHTDGGSAYVVYGGHGFEFLVRSLPSQLYARPEMDLSLFLSLKNIGKELTETDLGANPQSIRFTYTLHDEQKNVVGQGYRLGLPPAINGKDWVDIRLLVMAPSQIGNYQLQFAMVKEHEFWLPRLGAADEVLAELVVY